MEILSAKEIQTIRYYEKNAFSWAEKRRKLSEPSFWKDEIAELQRLKKPQGRILEIGSGSGRESLELMRVGYQYTGVDSSNELLKIAQKNNPLGNFIYANCYELPFAAQTFEAVFSWAMLPHVPKDKLMTALIEIKRVMKNDGLGFFL